MTNIKEKNIGLEGGTYEIIQQRLQEQAKELNKRLQLLNNARKEVFGAIETQLIANDRINTNIHCTAQDVFSIGNQCLFGYNVHVGLRSGIKLSDVFSIYHFEDNHFHESDMTLLNNDKFQTDFQNLYRYYKQAYFARFVVLNSYLYMVFHVSKEGTDFKVFKWLIREDKLEYIDARSDQEVRFPNQHEFKWERAHRDFHRNGKHPHVSILDRVFVETVGGDLTIKVEDNTDDGLGIYREEVEYKEQTLDDAEYFFADLGNLIVLKIKPYQEDFRYFVFNEKVQEIQRIDSLEDSGVLLPDQHGLIFANGYYLQTGEFKLFDPDMRNKQFKKRIISPNGEDFLYVFYNNKTGVYVLLHYNLIEQKVITPIICNGYTLFPNGELCYFRAEKEATKHHVMQIWQTPFVSTVAVPSDTDSYLFKVGNKDIVKAMAECHEILTLSNKQDSYYGLYNDLLKKSTDLTDAYYWISKPETFNMQEVIQQIGETASTAIDEFEKKNRIEKNTRAEILKAENRAKELFKQSRSQTFDKVDLFVETLAELRVFRGQIISLKELRYTDLPLLEKLETECADINTQLSNDCVKFLLEDNSLKPYLEKIALEKEGLETIKTAAEAKVKETNVEKIGQELELLIEIVNNLNIEDATHTSKIIEAISSMFAGLNQVKAAIKKKQKSLGGKEAITSFNAQIKLLDQGIISYLDLADTPQKSDEYLTKLMVQLEELESKFVEFDDFIIKITDKREEVYTAFENRKNSLKEARNNRTLALQKAADRILNGIQTRVKNIKTLDEINGFFAGDLMIDKVRDLIRQLNELEDSNKANIVQTKLKALKEETIRQLRDRQDLFVDGENIIQLGKHKFSVNIQALDLTIVQEKEALLFHLTGTDFFSVIKDPAFEETKSVWAQSLISETAEVYRSEYLAHALFQSIDKEKLNNANGQLIDLIKENTATRYQEGYTTGIHDEDANMLLDALLKLSKNIDLLYFSSNVRACANIFWKHFLDKKQQELFQQQLSSAGTILKVFPETQGFDYLIKELKTVIELFQEETDLFGEEDANKVAQYLFRELSRGDRFIVSQEAANLRESFLQFLKINKSENKYRDSVLELEAQKSEQFLLIQKWVQAYLEQTTDHSLGTLAETATLLFLDDYKINRVLKVATTFTIDQLHGDHPLLEQGSYELNYNSFMDKMERYNTTVVPRFKKFQALKKQVAVDFKDKMNLEDFKPRVLSSFVRNQLIDKVYLPLFGDNLAKQIGTVGENTRTDRMGMLLLVSPPGYGKTTLMEYIADRLGLIFMKINGPALGHQVRSLDPMEATNLAARQELEKLNLALEMGNNVMLYLDDIQHCNPEFLQKFISLCDGQRKIEGVYENKSKAYDLRGKRFCVIMAGNPYTESGDKFQIPDMLANRADIYNLGDIIGDSETVFKLSYIENAITSNPVLQKLGNKSFKDVHTILKIAETGNQDNIEFTSNHTPEEIREYVSIMKKMLTIRDVVLTVNKAYIHSAAISDDYRTEPSFKLQGSYRDMNKLSEKAVAIMNDQELKTLIFTHYENESQTLTSDAEANFLKLKELIGEINPTEQSRWDDIKKTFNKNKLFRNMDGNNPMAQILAQMTAFTDGIDGIREALEERNEGL